MPASTTAPDHAREARLRRRAARNGLIVRKSRLRGTPHSDDHGGYMILDANLNAIVAGQRFDLDLDDVEGCLPD